MVGVAVCLVIAGCDAWPSPVDGGQVDGKFHEGDCYVLLSTARNGTGFSYSTHFWIGKESSQASHATGWRVVSAPRDRSPRFQTREAH